MIADFARLALNNLRKRGIRSWLTMLGIFIGIAAVVSLISLGTGLQEAITGQFNTISPDILLVQSASTGFGPPGSTAVRKMTEDDLKIIEKIQGVDQAIPRLVRVAQVEFNKKIDFTYVASMPEEQEKVETIYGILSLEASSGRLLKADDRGKVIVGDDFTDDRSFGKPLRVGSQIKIGNGNFEVVGVLKKGSSFQVNSVILMAEEDMREVLKVKKNEIDLISVKVENIDEASDVAESIKRALRKDRKEKEGEEDFEVQTPVQALASVNTVLSIINLIVSGIAAISLIVGGIGITNTMYTSVLERTREIGVMKAIGARNSDILSIFLIESGLLGLAGGVIGAAIGLGLAFTISSIIGEFLGGVTLNVSVSWLLLSGAIGFSLVVGLMAGLLPAVQASRLKPVEALRA